MKIDNYVIGRYHAIIKSYYEDGSISYETSFSSEADLEESVLAVKHSIGKVVGLATDHPCRLIKMDVIRGKDNIIRELTNKEFLYAKDKRN